MSFAVSESAGGQPVELYVFTLAALTWRYTSGDAAITIPTGAAAGTYDPAVITRQAIQGTDESANGQLTVTVGRDLEVAALLYFDRLIRGALTLTVYRYHRGDVSQELVTIFTGGRAGRWFA